jgi:PAS domain S-box-containing protein
MPEADQPLARLRSLTETLIGPELFGRLLEALPDALVVVNAGGEVVLFNSQAELLLGYHRSEVIGRSVDMLVPAMARDRHAAHRQRFSEAPQTRPMGSDLQLAAQRKDGSEIPVAINLSPIVSPEGLFTMAVIRRRA